MKLRLSRRAGSQIRAIGQHIATRNPAAAGRVVAALFDTFDLLMDLPEIGHPLRRGSLREWVVPGLPYVVVYRVDAAEGALTIVAVYHAAQNRPGR